MHLLFNCDTKIAARVEDTRMARENKKINVQTHVSKSIFCCISNAFVFSVLTGGPVRELETETTNVHCIKL